MHELLITQGWTFKRGFLPEYHKQGPKHYQNYKLELSGSLEQNEICICYDNGANVPHYIYDGPCNSVEKLQQILNLLEI